MKQPQSSPLLSQKPSEQQLKQRRRQKILLRSQIVASQDLPTSHVQIKNNSNIDKKSQLTAYEMFRTSQRHEKIKIKLQIIGIVLGLISAILHLFTQSSPYSFGASFFLILLPTAYFQITRMQRISKYSSNQAQIDPLIAKVSNIKQLQIANKVLSLQSAITPLTKFCSTFLLIIVLFGCLNSK